MNGHVLFYRAGRPAGMYETHDVDELRQFESEFDGEPVGIVADGPDETIVVGQ